MEKMSIPTTDEIPKPETYRYLYDNHEKLNKWYREALGWEGLDAARITYLLEQKMLEI